MDRGIFRLFGIWGTIKLTLDSDHLMKGNQTAKRQKKQYLAKRKAASGASVRRISCQCARHLAVADCCLMVACHGADAPPSTLFRSVTDAEAAATTAAADVGSGGTTASSTLDDRARSEAVVPVPIDEAAVLDAIATQAMATAIENAQTGLPEPEPHADGRPLLSPAGVRAATAAAAAASAAAAVSVAAAPEPAAPPTSSHGTTTDVDGAASGGARRCLDCLAKANSVCKFRKCANCCSATAGMCSLTSHNRKRARDELTGHALTLQDAMQASTALYVNYRTGDQDPTVRAVVPKQWLTRGFSFQGWCVKDNKLKHYFVQRIVDISVRPPIRG